MHPIVLFCVKAGVNILFTVIIGVVLHEIWSLCKHSNTYKWYVHFVNYTAAILVSIGLLLLSTGLLVLLWGYK